MTAILKLRDESGNVYEIPALVGKKGDKGDTGSQGPQGIQGPQGEKGDKGDQGDTEIETATIEDIQRLF